jgi:RHS repeat-associated protein
MISDQGQKSLEYKNKSGQVVCTKVQKTPGDDINYFVTYFVYDDLQNMRFKITPEAVNNLAAINYTFSYNDAFTRQWLFSYNYDENSRQTIKRKPGAGEEFIVYDNLDRVVFTQDANMRAKAQPQWQATLYDVLSRPVITGLVTHAATLTDMQTTVDTRTSDLPIGSPGSGGDITLYQPSAGTHQASNSITMIDGFSTTGDFVAQIVPAAGGPQTSIIDGVAVNKNPLPPGAPFEILTVTYYDDYSWVAGTGTTLSNTIDGTYLNNSNYFITSSTAPEYAQPVQVNYHVRGRATGAKTKILGTNNQYLHAVTFYDTDGRTIQVQSINQSGGKDITTMQYDFTGKALRTLNQYEKKAGTNTKNYLVLSRTEYYKNGLSYRVWKKIGTDPEHLVSTSTYSEIGEVKTRTLGNGIESLDYTFNMRGWLTTINKDYLTAPDNAVPTHWFGMELGYENNNSVVNNTSYNNPRFNGVITGTVWKSRGAGVKRKVDYTYDNIDRLTAAGFKEQFGSVWANTDPVNQNFTIDFGIGGKGNSNQFIEYDDNGNIKNLWQKGLKVNNSANIDDLVYEYVSGNQLGKVTDGQNDPDTKLGDFHDGGNAGYDYDYDPNGNLTKDENKKISSITYNYLSLPEVITFANSNGNSSTITYTYDATGSRQKKVVVDKSTTGKTVTLTTTYLFGGVYESRTTVNPAPTDPADYTDELRYLSHEEGRMRWVPASSSFVFDYFITDQLGNVRTILTEEQKTDLYPMASMEDVPNKNDLTDPKNYIPYYANSDYNVDAGVRYGINNITGYPNTADANVTAPNNYVARLNGNGKKVGPSVVLKVMAGDKFNLQVSSWYKTNGVSPDVPVNPLSDLVAVLANSAAGISGKLSPADLQNSNFLGPNITRFLDNKTVAPDRPKAYVNWVLFDEQFRYVESSSSFEQVPAETEYQNTGNVHWHRKNDLPVDKSGYLYVYVSNETPNIDVFFDNLQVTHSHGPLLEENHYYPMGSPMAGICSQALNGLAVNKHKYQGKELEADLGLNLYDFHARQYDAQIGRFHVPDPANQFASPYLGMGNTWPNGTDPDGKVFIVDDILIGAAIGAAIASATYVGGNFMNGGTWKDLNFKDWSRAAAMGAVGGALGAGFAQGGAALFGEQVAHSMGYQMASNIATQVGTSVAFGNRITVGSIIGAAIGGAIDGAIPQFQAIGHKGSYSIIDGVKNGIAELAYNTARGALVGGISGGLGAAFDGGDIGQGTIQGMRSGALGGAVRTALNLAVFGPAIKPNGEAEKAIKVVEAVSGVKILSGAAAPIYRVGGLMKIFADGQTVGRTLMVNGKTGKDESNIRDIWLHETMHYLQQMKVGYGGQLAHGMWEQWVVAAFKGATYPYTTPNYYEFDARFNSSFFYDMYARPYPVPMRFGF